MDENKKGRPTDPLTAQDAAQLVAVIQAEGKRTREVLRELLQGTAANTAMVHREVVHLKGVMAELSTGLAHARVSRLEEEVEEAERERRVLEERLQVVTERLEIKKTNATGAVDTNERIKRATEMAVSERRQLEREKQAQWWQETFQLAGRAIIISFGVGAAGGVLAFVWWLFQLYSNR